MERRRGEAKSLVVRFAAAAALSRVERGFEMRKSASFDLLAQCLLRKSVRLLTLIGDDVGARR